MSHNFKNIKIYNLYLILIATQAPSVACKLDEGVGLLKELLNYNLIVSRLSENKKKIIVGSRKTRFDQENLRTRPLQVGLLICFGLSAKDKPSQRNCFKRRPC